MDNTDNLKGGWMISILFSKFYLHRIFSIFLKFYHKIPRFKIRYFISQKLFLNQFWGKSFSCTNTDIYNIHICIYIYYTHGIIFKCTKQFKSYFVTEYFETPTNEKNPHTLITFEKTNSKRFNKSHAVHLVNFRYKYVRVKSTHLKAGLSTHNTLQPKHDAVIRRQAFWGNLRNRSGNRKDTVNRLCNS